MFFSIVEHIFFVAENGVFTPYIAALSEVKNYDNNTQSKVSASCSNEEKTTDEK